MARPRVIDDVIVARMVREHGLKPAVVAQILARHPTSIYLSLRRSEGAPRRPPCVAERRALSNLVAAVERGDPDMVRAALDAARATLAACERDAERDFKEATR